MGSVSQGGVFRAATLMAVLALVTLAAACGPGPGTTGSPTNSGNLKAVAGCGATAAIGLSNTLPLHVPHCDPNTPAPQPLPQSVTLQVTSVFLGDATAPLLLAKRFGEFQKENLNIGGITVVQNPAALPALANGTSDAHYSDFGLTFQNAVTQGLPLKAVLGGNYPLTAGDTSIPQQGVWCRRSAFKTPDSPDPKDLNGTTVAALVVPPSTGPLYSFQQLVPKGLNISSLKWVAIPAASQQTALDTGAITCAAMGAPFFTPLISAPKKYVMIATFPPVPTQGYIFGPNLLTKNRAAGEAFVRAMIRTIDTYLQGDYHKDAKVVQALADELQVTPDRILATPATVFDYQMPSGIVGQIADAYVAAGYLPKDQVSPESKLLDRSFIETVVGRRSEN